MKIVPSVLLTLGLSASVMCITSSNAAVHGRGLAPDELDSLRGGYRRCRNISRYDCAATVSCPAEGPCVGEAMISVPSLSGSWFRCIFWFFESYCSPEHPGICIERRPCTLIGEDCVVDMNAEPIEEEEASQGCLKFAAPPVVEFLELTVEENGPGGRRSPEPVEGFQLQDHSLSNQQVERIPEWCTLLWQLCLLRSRSHSTTI